MLWKPGISHGVLGHSLAWKALYLTFKGPVKFRDFREMGPSVLLPDHGGLKTTLRSHHLQCTSTNETKNTIFSTEVEIQELKSNHLFMGLCFKSSCTDLNLQLKDVRAKLLPL